MSSKRKTLNEALDGCETVSLEGLRTQAAQVIMEEENAGNEDAVNLRLIFDVGLFVLERLESIETSLRVLAEEAANVTEVG